MRIAAFIQHQFSQLMMRHLVAFFANGHVFDKCTRARRAAFQPRESNPGGAEQRGVLSPGGFVGSAHIAQPAPRTVADALKGGVVIGLGNQADRRWRLDFGALIKLMAANDRYGTPREKRSSTTTKEARTRMAISFKGCFCAAGLQCRRLWRGLPAHRPTGCALDLFAFIVLGKGFAEALFVGGDSPEAALMAGRAVIACRMMAPGNLQSAILSTSAPRQP